MATAEAGRNPGYPQYGGFFLARCSFTASHAFADQAMAWPMPFPAPVCTENLNAVVAVMKSAQDGARTDDTGSLNRASNRRILV